MVLFMGKCIWLTLGETNLGWTHTWIVYNYLTHDVTVIASAWYYAHFENETFTNNERAFGLQCGSYDLVDPTQFSFTFHGSIYTWSWQLLDHPTCLHEW